MVDAHTVSAASLYAELTCRRTVRLSKRQRLRIVHRFASKAAAQLKYAACGPWLTRRLPALLTIETIVSLHETLHCRWRELQHSYVHGVWSSNYV